ncbi:MAG TPA: CDGSH iron-sulfur domain-containing protein [Candidatus Dormibacteraeota bacterium]|nr:CDGSH iron-sulfur domain-containing protein [Candidatus Dormibacteraeota bacterium]
MTQSTTEPKVVVSRNGPYLVSGAVPLARQTVVSDGEGNSVEWRESAPFPVKESYALCRCGHSANKPFCDGTHRKVGFDGTETASRAPYRELAQRFEGPVHSLTDAQSLCAGADFCNPNGAVWNQVEQTDEGAVRANFLRQVQRCPSGRLVAWERASGAPLEPPLARSVGVIGHPHEGASGPLWVRGGVPVVSADGFTYEVRNRVTLCRCGASKNKPFCDGTHYAIKFNDGAVGS